MCVSQHIFCCCCRGNFEHCSLTVKRVIHPLVDLPSVLALKTNNLSLDWVYSCLDSGRKTGRLKKIRPLAALVLIFSLHYLHKCCVPCALSGNHLAVTLWHTRTWKIEGKGGKKMEKEDECVSFKRMKGGKREKKDVLVMWISYKRTCKIQWTQQCRHPSQLPASHRFVFKHFYFFLKKKLQNWSTMLRLQRKIKEQSCLSCVRNESKKKKNPKPADDDMIRLCSCR